MLKNYSSYILYTLIAVLIISLYLGNFTGLEKLQWNVDDLMYAIKGQGTPASDIILVNIDDKSIDAVGKWPWPYDKLGDLIAVCNTAEPRSMLVNIDMPSRISEDTLGNTKILGNQISWCNNIIITYDIALGEYSNQKLSRPEYLFKSSIQTESDLGILNDEQALNIRKPFLPSGMICEHADGLGFIYNEYAYDRTIRWSPLVANYDGYYYPSASLLMAALQMGYTADDIKITGGEYIKLGLDKIPTNEYGRTYLNYNTPNTTFRTYSAIDILDETTNLSDLKGKAVIISYAGMGGVNLYTTPVTDKMPEYELLANTIENIIHKNHISRLNLSTGLEILIIFGLGIFGAIIMPRVTLLYRLVILLVGLIILANLNYVLFSGYQIMPRFLYFGFEMVLMMIVAPLLDDSKINQSFGAELAGIFSFLKKSDDDSPDTSSTTIRELLETDNQPEFERTKAFKSETQINATTDLSTKETIAMKSTPTGRLLNQPDDYGQISGDSPSEQVLPSPRQDSSANNINIDDEIIANELTPLSDSSGSLIQSMGESDRINQLGRYKVLGILGKGAMGTVFKGVDPAINRPVALKTIRLDFVSDENELIELRDRLFREAQAAGKLSHPNIVTIYDVGSEGSLQYIAMEYLEGQDLESLIKRKVQFSYKIIAKIIIDICYALDYAHEQNIVHRDVKPANIMVLKDYSIKVMDFGIARVDSSSMTKTGIAMGTPNYISPELLQGKEVDRRCDIFSLGVVIYELLTGQRPFKGENMTALIYSIINKEHIPPSTVNENIPALFDHIVSNALKKNPVERFQRAGEINKLLADYVESFTRVR